MCLQIPTLGRAQAQTEAGVQKRGKLAIVQTRIETEYPQRARTTQFGRVARHKLREEIRENWLQLRSCGGEAPPGGKEHAVTIPSSRPVKERVASAKRQLPSIRRIRVHNFVKSVLSDLRSINR